MLRIVANLLKSVISRQSEEKESAKLVEIWNIPATIHFFFSLAILLFPFAGTHMIILLKRPCMVCTDLLSFGKVYWSFSGPG